MRHTVLLGVALLLAACTSTIEPRTVTGADLGDVEITNDSWNCFAG